MLIESFTPEEDKPQLAVYTQLSFLLPTKQTPAQSQEVALKKDLKERRKQCKEGNKNCN